MAADNRVSYHRIEPPLPRSVRQARQGPVPPDPVSTAQIARTARAKPCPVRVQAFAQPAFRTGKSRRPKTPRCFCRTLSLSPETCRREVRSQEIAQPSQHAAACRLSASGTPPRHMGRYRRRPVCLGSNGLVPNDARDITRTPHPRVGSGSRKPAPYGTAHTGEPFAGCSNRTRHMAQTPALSGTRPSEMSRCREGLLADSQRTAPPSGAADPKQQAGQQSAKSP